MNRCLWISLLVTTAAGAAKCAPASSARETPTWLRLSSDGKHLATPEGRPLFWLGEGVWYRRF